MKLILNELIAGAQGLVQLSIVKSSHVASSSYLDSLLSAGHSNF